ncbi:MAG: NAD(P)H-hydrate dehydratase [Candidatus Limnocylindrales bacterium]
MTTSDAGAAALPELDDASAASLIPPRDPRGHKGTHGKLLVVAGSLDYLGAALLVTRSAYRAGAGLVRLAVPDSLQPLVAGRIIEATTLGLPETDVAGEVHAEGALDRLLDLEHDAAVVGPGLRPGLATVELIFDYLAASGEATPVVVDAEALNSLATIEGWWQRVRRPCVLTPHVGELTKLMAAAGDAFAAVPDSESLRTDDAVRARTAILAAAAWGQVVVLKGARTVIAGGAAPATGGGSARAFVAPFTNPALGTGGTGDVLSGVIGALLAGGLAPFEAACLGVYVHGSAGEVVRERLGDAGLMASDLPDEIARVRRRLAGMAERRRSGRRLGFGAREDGA